MSPCSRGTGAVPALVVGATARQYGPYRSRIAFVDRIAEQYDVNDDAAFRLQELIQDAVDPERILSPVEQGIRPADAR